MTMKLQKTYKISHQEYTFLFNVFYNTYVKKIARISIFGQTFGLVKVVLCGSIFFSFINFEKYCSATDILQFILQFRYQ